MLLNASQNTDFSRGFVPRTKTRGVPIGVTLDSGETATRPTGQISEIFQKDVQLVGVSRCDLACIFVVRDGLP